MNILKLIISIALFSSYFALVNNAYADLSMSPDFYQHGAFTNDDFRPSDNYLPSDYYNYYQSDGIYYPDYTVMDVNGYDHTNWDEASCYCH